MISKKDPWVRLAMEVVSVAIDDYLSYEITNKNHLRCEYSRWQADDAYSFFTSHRFDIYRDFLNLDPKYIIGVCDLAIERSYLINEFKKDHPDAVDFVLLNSVVERIKSKVFANLND